jgi:uncharacterized protein YyaL (SSP411 family)
MEQLYQRKHRGDSFMNTQFSRRGLLVGAPSMLGAAKITDGPYLAAARQFLDTMITKGVDRFGSKNTPMFCMVLDPETYVPPKAPQKVDWEYRRGFEYLYRDFGYYWKSHLHSSNLIYDQGTIRALEAMTAACGDKKYKRASDAYINYFLGNLVSEQTGIFGWGEHCFYNVFADYILSGAFTVRSVRHFSHHHELERWTTIYDVLWAHDAVKTQTEIDAIFEFKIHDPVTFMNNRHSDYYAGRVTTDVLTFSKHSGLFAHAFAFAYSKTRERRYLDWAKKAAELFWGIRDPKTNLVRDSVQRKDEPATDPGLLALFLLRAYQWHAEQLFVDYAVAYLEGYAKHFAAGKPGEFRAVVSVDGTDRKPGQLATYWESPLRVAKAATLAYSITGKSNLLELADTVITTLTLETVFDSVVQRSLVSDDLEARSCALSTAIDLYEVTANSKYLDKAQQLADDAMRKFLYRGLFVSELRLYPEGDKSAKLKIYDARAGAGWLALNLIRLQRDTDATKAGKFRKLNRLEAIYD